MAERKALTKAQKTFFLEHYKLTGNVAFTKKYNERFKEKRHQTWTACVAKRLGISNTCPEGYYDVPTVSFLTGAREDTIRASLRKGQFEGIKVGKFWFVTIEEFEKIKEHWKGLLDKPKWTAISCLEASRMIGITEKTMPYYAKNGTLDAYKVGKDWMVRKSDIEALINRMRKTGSPRVDWAWLAAQKKSPENRAG